MRTEKGEEVRHRITLIARSPMVECSSEGTGVCSAIADCCSVISSTCVKCNATKVVPEASVSDCHGTSCLVSNWPHSVLCLSVVQNSHTLGHWQLAARAYTAAPVEPQQHKHALFNKAHPPCNAAAATLNKKAISHRNTCDGIGLST